jgi:PqqD family protein of HPr-rel-A system
VVDDLRFRTFDDEAVVFDPVSWDAHLLNPAALAVLELFLEAPRSTEDIVSFLADALEAGEQTDAPAHAERLIRELRYLGLIRRIDEASRADR